MPEGNEGGFNPETEKAQYSENGSSYTFSMPETNQNENHSGQSEDAEIPQSFRDEAARIREEDPLKTKSKETYERVAQMVEELGRKQSGDHDAAEGSIASEQATDEETEKEIALIREQLKDGGAPEFPIEVDLEAENLEQPESPAETLESGAERETAETKQAEEKSENIEEPEIAEPSDGSGEAESDEGNEEREGKETKKTKRRGRLKKWGKIALLVGTFPYGPIGYAIGRSSQGQQNHLRESGNGDGGGQETEKESRAKKWGRRAFFIATFPFGFIGYKIGMAENLGRKQSGSHSSSEGVAETQTTVDDNQETTIMPPPEGTSSEGAKGKTQETKLPENQNPQAETEKEIFEPKRQQGNAETKKPEQPEILTDLADNNKGGNIDEMRSTTESAENEELLEELVRNGALTIHTSLPSAYRSDQKAGFSTEFDKKHGYRGNPMGGVSQITSGLTGEYQGSMAQHTLRDRGINEVLQISPVSKSIYETVRKEVEKPSGFMGLRKKKEFTTEQKYVGEEPVLHSSIINGGDNEQAFSIHYGAFGSGYKDYSNREGQILAAEIVVSRSLADKVAEAVKKDPHFIRSLVDKAIPSSLGIPENAWFKGDDATGGHPLRPPFESWDSQTEGEKMHFIDKTKEVPVESTIAI